MVSSIEAVNVLSTTASMRCGPPRSSGTSIALKHGKAGSVGSAGAAAAAVLVAAALFAAYDHAVLLSPCDQFYACWASPLGHCPGQR